MGTSLSPHDQGREASQLCGANLKEGSFTGLLQVGWDLKTVTTTTGRPGPRWIPWPYGVQGLPQGVVFWSIWLRSVPSIFLHPQKKTHYRLRKLIFCLIGFKFVRGTINRSVVNKDLLFSSRTLCIKCVVSETCIFVLYCWLNKAL